MNGLYNRRSLVWSYAKTSNKLLTEYVSTQHYVKIVMYLDLDEVVLTGTGTSVDPYRIVTDN